MLTVSDDARVSSISVGAPREPRLEGDSIKSNPSMTSDLRISVLQQLCTAEPTEEELALLHQILQRPGMLSRIQPLEQISRSAVDNISEAEPIPRVDASEGFPVQQHKGPSEINSESEGADIESLPQAPISKKPHRRLTLPPAQRDREDARQPTGILLQRYN